MLNDAADGGDESPSRGLAFIGFVLPRDSALILDTISHARLEFSLYSIGCD